MSPIWVIEHCMHVAYFGFVDRREGRLIRVEFVCSSNLNADPLGTNAKFTAYSAFDKSMVVCRGVD